MSETKHTSGPWKYEGEPHGYTIGSTSTVVARTRGVDTVQEEEANARLIAAAPDLLAACEALRDSVKHGDGCGDACKLANAAIAKARA